MHQAKHGVQGNALVFCCPNEKAQFRGLNADEVENALPAGRARRGKSMMHASSLYVPNLPKAPRSRQQFSRTIGPGASVIRLSTSGIRSDVKIRLKYGWREWIGAGLLGSVPLAAHAAASLTTGREWGSAEAWFGELLFLGIVTSGGALAALLHWVLHRRRAGLRSNAAATGAILLNAIALLGAAALYGLASGRMIELGVWAALLALAASEMCTLGLLLRGRLQNGAIAMRSRTGEWWRSHVGKRKRKFSSVDLNYLDDNEAGWG